MKPLTKMQRSVLRVCLANPRAVPCDPAVKASLAGARILARRPAKSLSDVLSKRVGELSERAKKKRKEQPRCRTISNPTNHQLSMSVQPSLATLWNAPDNRNVFSSSVIIKGKEYVVTGAAYWSAKRKGRLVAMQEYDLHELIRPLPSALSDECHHRAFVVRSGTFQRYALGPTVYYRERKLHKKPSPW
jgi:hypothetical protein